MARYCDIVMKGGITSGVVYPLAAVELSKHYRFRNIGGTSAGAIAAAAVAAAEHGRNGGREDVFDEIADLPIWLGAHLTDLFQPERATRPLFRILLAATVPESPPAKAAAALRAAVIGFPLAALLGALPGVALAVASIASGGGFLLGWGIVCAVLGIVLGVLIGLGIAIVVRALRTLPRQGFGLLSGYGPTPPDGVPPLTTWLADLLDRLAGKSTDEPLTFGDLWGGSDPDGERDVNLEMMTTCITQGRPYRLPFSTRRFWFDPAEFSRLFPSRVVAQMVKRARTDERATQFEPLLPFPKAAEVPVVVATRMSLSFPILLSAVPLHAIDYSREIPEDERRPEPCWFSDGGITSNFPVHFFDSPVPRWPTFGIDLRKFGRGESPSKDESKNIWMPFDNRSGSNEAWTDWTEERPGGQLAAFMGAVFKTMQNWVDNSQSRVPGYRDRIVHISHSKREGGLNLSMPPPVIGHLSSRGQFAGDLLRRRFAVPPETDSPLTWDNQRWVRYRSFMRLLEETLTRLRRGCVEQLPEDRPIEQLSRRGPDEPPGYHWTSHAQRDLGLEGTAAVIALIEAWEAGEQSFAEGAPEPSPELRVAPKI